MLGINYLAVVVAAVAAFVVSTVWYIVFGKAMMKLQGAKPDAMADMEKPQPWKILVEIVRSLVVAYVLARFGITPALRSVHRSGMSEDSFAVHVIDADHVSQVRVTDGGEGERAHGASVLVVLPLSRLHRHTQLANGGAVKAKESVNPTFMPSPYQEAIFELVCLEKPALWRARPRLYV